MAYPRTRFTVVSVILAASLWFSSAVRAQTTIYVAPDRAVAGDGSKEHPYHSIHEALRRVAAAKHEPKTGVEIVLLPGIHRIKTPIEITSAHVPSKGRLALRGSRKGETVISGGIRLKDWQVTADGRWKTKIPPEVVRSGLPRELFCGDQRRPRARHPNRGYLRIGKAFPDKRSGFTFRRGDLPTDYGGGGELVFLHDWSTSRIRVAEVDHGASKLTVAHPIGAQAPHYRIDHFEPHPRYFLENHPSFLDQPGEWIVDSDGVLTYYPRPGETPEQTELTIPVARRLVSVHGKDGSPVANVELLDLTFVHAAWPLPERGFAASQACSYESRGPDGPRGRSFVPAAVVFELATGCRIAGCRIAHLGGSGVELGSRTTDCVLEDSVLEDISGNGVNLAEGRTRRVGNGQWWRAAPEQVAKRNVVRYNRITGCGRQFFGAVAIWCGLGAEMRIHHNEIAHHPYTGVSLGWMWNPSPTPARGNIVSDNHIHHVMQILSDGGGIYTLGHQPGTRLLRNVIHDVPVNAGRAESNGMFLDEGSDRIEIGRNTIYHTARSPLRFHRARQMWVHDNLLVIPHSKTPAYRYNATDPKTIRRENDRIVLADQFDAAGVPSLRTGPRK